jgi:diacylglycerol kinase (ATP)
MSADMLVIANRAAGSTEQEAVSEALEVLRGDGPAELRYAESREQLDELLERLDGRTLVVVGGDGSLHTTVAALHARGDLGSVTMGLIPLGTGNDLARGLGIPLDPREAARLVLDGKPTPLDLLVDDTGGVVVNAVHVGVGADAAQAATPMKSRLGPLAFPVGAVIAGLRTKGWRLEVVVDGRTIAVPRRKALMVGLANAPSIAGGTAQLHPHADPQDGLVDVVVSHSVSPLARVGYAFRLLNGGHTRREDVVTTRAKEVSVAGEPFWLNADGEVTGPTRHRSWTVAAGAWKLILSSDESQPG